MFEGRIRKSLLYIIFNVMANRKESIIIIIRMESIIIIIIRMDLQHICSKLDKEISTLVI